MIILSSQVDDKDTSSVLVNLQPKKKYTLRKEAMDLVNVIIINYRAVRCSFPHGRVHFKIQDCLEAFLQADHSLSTQHVLC